MLEDFNFQKALLMGFLNKCDQIRGNLRIWSHLPKSHLLKTSFFVR